jgi:hypothetical protein
VEQEKQGEGQQPRTPVYAYEVVMKIGKVKKTLRVVAVDDADAERRVRERFKIESVKRGAELPHGSPEDVSDDTE